MRTLTFTDDEFALLVESMHTRAWHAQETAKGITRDGDRFMREAKRVGALARKIEKLAPTAPKAAFTRGGYSFRPVRQNETDLIGWVVSVKGGRDTYSERAYIDPASDGICYTVNMANVGHRTDARPSFAEACDLVMARLPREG